MDTRVGIYRKAEHAGGAPSSSCATLLARLKLMIAAGFNTEWLSAIELIHAGDRGGSRIRRQPQAARRAYVARRVHHARRRQLPEKTPLSELATAASADYARDHHQVAPKERPYGGEGGTSN
jgi:hypothetical protein